MTLQNVMRELADPESSVRHTSLVQLSGLTNAELSEVLPDWARAPAERRCEILERLAEIAVDNIELDFGAFFRACMRDGAPTVRVRAVRGLWECEDRTVIRPLIELLKRDQSSDVRAATATALSKFAEMAGEGKLIRRDGQRIREALLTIIDSPDEDIEARRRAIEAVATLNSSDVRSIIEKAYADSDPRLRQSAIYAMGRTSDARWLPTVIRETGNDDEAIRYEAAIACGLLGEDDVVPLLVNLLNDDDSQVQLAVVRSLGLIGGDLARRALTQAMRHGDDAIEEAAEEALAGIEFDEDPLGFRFEG